MIIVAPTDALIASPHTYTRWHAWETYNYMLHVSMLEDQKEKIHDVAYGYG